MIGAIGTLLKGSFDENLKKLFQPAALIPAAVLFLLNLLFIVPILADLQVPLAAALVTPEDGWSLAVAVAVVIMLAYLLLSFSSTIESLMTGELWDDSPLLGTTMSRLQLRRMNELRQQAGERLVLDKSSLLKLRMEFDPHVPPLVNAEQTDQTSLEQAKRQQALLERRLSFPSNFAFLTPTALGNVLVAAAYGIWERYGIDISVLWPHMEYLVENEKLATRLNDDRTTLSALLNLTFVLAIFALEVLLVYGWMLMWPQALACVIPLALALLVYRAAVERARSWSEAIKVTFDLYRETLRDKLNVREFKSGPEERPRWRRVSRWLLWSNRADDDFEYPPANSHSAAASPDTIKVASFEAIKRPVGGSAQARTRSVTITLFEREYHLLLNNSDTAPARALVAVEDAAMPIIEQVPSADAALLGIGTAIAAILPTGKTAPAHMLLWTIPTFPPKSAVALCYSLPLRTIKVSVTQTGLIITSFTVKVAGQGQPKCEFSVFNEGDTIMATLDVEDAGLGSVVVIPEGSLSVAGRSTDFIKAEWRESPNSYRWKLGELKKGETAQLTYSGHGEEN